jgi:hypothetical protein
MRNTAVEWLIAELSYLELTKNKGSFRDYFDIRLKAYEQAKQMEKEQIVDAYDNGCAEWTSMEYSDGQHYYNSTYEK